MQRSSRWRTFLSRISSEHSWTYVDLYDELSKLPRDQIDALFLGNEVPYLAAAGHYSRLGNRRVATALYARLTDRPEVQSWLAAARQNGSN